MKELRAFLLGCPSSAPLLLSQTCHKMQRIARGGGEDTEKETHSALSFKVTF